MKKRLLQYLVWLGVLCTGFILCRYILFSMHGMREWPVLLFAVGAVILTASFPAKARYVPAVTAAAYPLAFLFGVLLQSDGIDPGGGRTNNLWIIWTVAFIGMVAIVCLIELFTKKRK